MSEKNFVTIILLSILAVMLTNCRKDIDVPRPELEKLFGTWEWTQSSGGWGGSTYTSDNTDNTRTLQFNKDGVYKEFENGNMILKRKYIIQGEDDAFYSQFPAIAYLQTGLFDSNDYLGDQSIVYLTNDTLLLHDTCSDCWGHIYVRN